MKQEHEMTPGVLVSGDDMSAGDYKARVAVLEAELAELRGRVDQEAKVFWVLFDNTGGEKYIKKDADAGTLAFFDNEEDAARAKRFNLGTDYMRIEYYTTPQPAPAAQDVAGLEFTLVHPADGETHTVTLTREEIQERMTDELYEKLGRLICHCEPVGEESFADCNCIDRIEEFEVAAHQSGGAK